MTGDGPSVTLSKCDRRTVPCHALSRPVTLVVLCRVGGVEAQVQRLRAVVDRYDAFFDDAFPDDPFLKGSLDGEWDAFQRRHGGRP